MRTRMLHAIIVLAAMIASAGAQEPPGSPVPLSAPAINSVRPDQIVRAEPGDDESRTLTVYATHFVPELGAVEVLWDGEPLVVTPSESHPSSRLLAEVPASFLAEEGTVSVVLRQNTPAGPLDSPSVGLRVVGEIEPCDLPSEQEAICGAALGELPVIEMVPRHAWYPFATVPAGGIVEVRNRDIAGDFANHTVTSTTLEDRLPLVTGSGDDSFDLKVSHPPEGSGVAGVTEAEVGYLRVPESKAPGDVIPFYCTAHSNDMVPPLGAITVQ